MWSVHRWWLRIPFKLRILPILRKLDAFEYGARASLSIKEAKIAGPFPPLPNTFHSRLESPFTHFFLTLLHRHIVTVKSDMLDAFLSASLDSFSPGHPLKDILRYLLQILRHQALPARGLHDLERQIAVFRKTHLELERACSAAEKPFWDRAGREVEDLKGADAKLEQAVHRFSVVATHDAYFGDGAEERAA